MLADLWRLLENKKASPFYSNINWPERGKHFFFPFLRQQDQLSHYELMTFVGVHPFVKTQQFVLLSWSLLQFVNLPLPVPGTPGGKAWCAVSDSDSFGPRGQTTGLRSAIPRHLVQQAPKQGMNAAMAFHNSYLRCWHISGVSNSARGTFAQIQTIAV